MNLRGGLEFAEDVSLKAAAQLEHKRAHVSLDFSTPVAVAVTVTCRCVPAAAGLIGLFPLFGCDTAPRPVIWTFCGANWLQHKVTVGSVCLPPRLQAVRLYRDVTLLPISFTVNNQEVTP